MEMIPLDDQASEMPPEAAPAAPEAASSGREPLVVESLENRVLLAADAAAAAPLVDTPEPPPLVAAPQRQHLEIDLQDLAEGADASGGGHAASEVVASGSQSLHAEPHQPEAEKIEYRNENAVEALPEHKDSNESEANDNEFGLATIEPPKSKAESAASQNERKRLVKPTDEDSKPADAAGAVVTAIVSDSGSETGPVALSGVAADVGSQLDVALIKAASVEANLDSLAAGDAGAKTASTDDEAAVLAQTVLKSDATLEATTAPPTGQADQIGSSAIEEDRMESLAAVDGAAAIEARQTVESPPAEEYNAQPLPGTPPAAHDALFAEGQGVEAVLERSSA